MKKIALLITSFYFFIYSSTVSAQQPQVINIGNKQPFGIKALNNPNASPATIVSNIILLLFIVGGMGVLLFVIWGAFDWVTSGGDKEKVSGARKKITNALIGLALLSLSAFIVALVGQIVGFDPTKTPDLPRLDQAITAPPATQ